MSKDIELNKQSVFILSVLKKTGDWTSPTYIGNEWGLKLTGEKFFAARYHSSWASPKCKRLVKLGLIKRNKKGWYKLA